MLFPKSSCPGASSTQRCGVRSTFYIGPVYAPVTLIDKLSSHTHTQGPSFLGLLSKTGFLKGYIHKPPALQGDRHGSSCQLVFGDSPVVQMAQMHPLNQRTRHGSPQAHCGSVVHQHQSIRGKRTYLSVNQDGFMPQRQSSCWKSPAIQTGLISISVETCRALALQTLQRCNRNCTGAKPHWFSLHVQDPGNLPLPGLFCVFFCFCFQLSLPTMTCALRNIRSPLTFRGEECSQITRSPLQFAEETRATAVRICLLCREKVWSPRSVLGSCCLGFPEGDCTEGAHALPPFLNS